jgi:hypothetical protein
MVLNAGLVTLFNRTGKEHRRKQREFSMKAYISNDETFH